MLERIGTWRVDWQGEVLSAAQLLKRPEVGWATLQELDEQGVLAAEPLDESDSAYLEANCKYEGYIRIQNQRVEQMKGFAATRIPGDLDYDRVPGLSIEMRQRLSRRAPETVAQAQAIAGVTPAAVNALRAYLLRQQRLKR